MNQTEKVWTVLEMIQWGTAYFEEKEIPDPRLSIEWLLADLLQLKRLDLYLQFDRPLSGKELRTLKPLVKRRASSEPLQYISGYCEFMDLTLRVNPSVLIPRMETEQLVELLLDKTDSLKPEPVRLLDLGTGSGCIPISIKKRRPNWYCRGTDLSGEAIRTAILNAELNDQEVDFLHQEFEDTIRENRDSWNIIVSNPPYITEEEKELMHRQVLNYEPHLALFHPDPLQLYRSLIHFAHSCHSLLFLECNHTTAENVAGLAAEIYPNCELQSDLNGDPRFLICTP